MACIVVDGTSNSGDPGGNENISPCTGRVCINLGLHSHSSLKNSSGQWSLSRYQEAGMPPIKFWIVISCNSTWSNFWTCELYHSQYNCIKAFCKKMYFCILLSSGCKDEDTELMPNGSQGLCGSDVWYNFVIKKISKHYHLFFCNILTLPFYYFFLLKLSIHPFQLLGQQYSSDVWQNYLFCLFLLLLDFVSLCFNICKDSWHLISGYYMDLRLLIFPSKLQFTVL